MKHALKKIYKSKPVQIFASLLFYIYMHVVYFTSKMEYEVPQNTNADYYKDLKNSILISWHDKIMILPHISPFKLHKKLHALVSPHNDGRIISMTMRFLGYKIVEGSSNKNAAYAVKSIIKILRNNKNIVITPDGPKGPRQKMKGSLIEIAKKCNSSIIPFTANCSKYFRLNSWDKLIFPLPFGRIVVRFGEPIDCNKNSKITLEELADRLNTLGEE